MSNDINWDELPSWVNFIATDMDDGTYFFSHRPEKLKAVWNNDDSLNHCEPACDYPDIVLPSFPVWQLSLRQRPGTLDSGPRPGDNVVLQDGKTYLVWRNLVGSLKLQDAAGRKYAFIKERVIQINSIPLEDKGHTAKPEPKKPQPALPVEVHNNAHIDGEEAFRILESLCKGH